MSNDTTTKIVINECFGGFGLSLDASREVLRRKGLEWTEEPSGFVSLGPALYVDGKYWTAADLDRADPALIAVVEEFGDEAHGRHATLVVHEVPKGTLYRIDEYDGNESIETRDRTDWSVA